MSGIEDDENGEDEEDDWHGPLAHAAHKQTTAAITQAPPSDTAKEYLHPYDLLAQIFHTLDPETRDEFRMGCELFCERFVIRGEDDHQWELLERGTWKWRNNNEPAGYRPGGDPKTEVSEAGNVAEDTDGEWDNVEKEETEDG